MPYIMNIAEVQKNYKKKKRNRNEASNRDREIGKGRLIYNTEKERTEILNLSRDSSFSESPTQRVLEFREFRPECVYGIASSYTPSIPFHHPLSLSARHPFLSL